MSIRRRYAPGAMLRVRPGVSRCFTSVPRNLLVGLITGFLLVLFGRDPRIELS